jgi:hypothetical protein
MEREYKLRIKIYCTTKGHITYRISSVVTLILVVNMGRSCTPKRTYMSYLLIWDLTAMATVQWTQCLSLTSLARSVPSVTAVFGIPSSIFTFSVHNGINTVHLITWLVFHLKHIVSVSNIFAQGRHKHKSEYKMNMVLR